MAKKSAGNRWRDSNSTKEAIGLAQHAKEAGADAVLVVTPYYNKPTQAGLYGHYKAINDEAQIPIIIYNIPGRLSLICQWTPWPLCLNWNILSERCDVCTRPTDLNDTCMRERILSALWRRWNRPCHFSRQEDMDVSRLPAIYYRDFARRCSTPGWREISIKPWIFRKTHARACRHVL